VTNEHVATVLDHTPVEPATQGHLILAVTGGDA
jgi:hypothetical protein